jgi:hypothetical protein
MRVQTYQCEYGTIEYALPNVKDVGGMLGELRKFDKNKNEGEILNWIILNLEKYVKKVELVFEGIAINSLEELLEYPELLGVIGDLNNKITEKTFGSVKKKD